MRVRVATLLMVLCLIAAPSLNFGTSLDERSSQSTHTSTDGENDYHESFVLEGQLSDPQDVDTYTIHSTNISVHSLTFALGESLHVEIYSDAGVLIERNLSQNETIHFSGMGENLSIDVSSIVFTAINNYTFGGYSSHSDGEQMIFISAIQDDDASGTLHASDFAGDKVSAWVGGNAPIRLALDTSGDVSVSVHLMDLVGGDIIPIAGGSDTSTIEFRTPDTPPGSDIWELVVRLTSNGSATWSLHAVVDGVGDSLCVHDCSGVLDADQFPNRAEDLTEERFVYTGAVGLNDSTDVYPVFIAGESWETHRVIATIEGDGVEVQIQSWNNSGDFLQPLDVATGVGTIGLNVTPGYHAIKVTGAGEYSLTLHSVNTSNPDDAPIDPGKLQDMWKEFIPFYIGIGLVMLAPMAYVLWSLRGNRMSGNVQAHERSRLKRLRSRLAELIEFEGDEHEITSALEMLEAVQWRATEVEMGEATLTHHTGSLTLKAWHLAAGTLLVGIHIEEQSWELAALRFNASAGSEWRITDVSPASLYDGDEIFLGTLAAGTTRFIRLSLEGSAETLDLHLSGLVDGEPLAAVPAKALLMD